MELAQHSLLEELIMDSKMDTPAHSESFLNTWTFAPSDQTLDLHSPATNTSFPQLISPTEYNYPCSFGELQPFLDASTSQEYGLLNEMDDLPEMAIQEEYATNVRNRQVGFLDDGTGRLGDWMNSYKVDSAQTTIPSVDIICVGPPGEKKSKAKKGDGQPSKNLMAERRRRKRLNDRLSMLRSIVPKISKMDRTSILGDAIDYMRELIDKIHKLRQEGIGENMDEINLIGNLKELKPNEMLVSNPPKVWPQLITLIHDHIASQMSILRSNHTRYLLPHVFLNLDMFQFDVERRNQDTRVEVCCTTKPGLLWSTLSTMDALGLDIQQCVISCFNDFSLQASCHEVAEHQSLVSSADIKQALFRNAGYGGRYL